VVLRRYAAYPLPALTDTGPASAASKRTTAPIKHTKPSPRKHSPDGSTPKGGGGHPITAYYSFIDLKRMKGWVGIVG